ncbi:hypothetical protein PO124_12180 [Bacillus licheniformis]|nr:hypothetical protein [Bacillus licheniformis]
MMFGIPAIALAIAHAARTRKRNESTHVFRSSHIADHRDYGTG